MSESSKEHKSVAEIREKLSDAPFYIQRLGIAAINLNYVAEFTFMLDQGLSPQDMYFAISQELERQGLSQPATWLELFDVPNMHD